MHPPSDPVRLRLAELLLEELHAEVARERLAQAATSLDTNDRARAAFIQRPRGAADLARAIRAKFRYSGTLPPGKPQADGPADA